MDDYTRFLWLRAGDNMEELEELASSFSDSCSEEDRQEEEDCHLIEQMLSDGYREDYHMVDSL